MATIQQLLISEHHAAWVTLSPVAAGVLNHKEQRQYTMMRNGSHDNSRRAACSLDQRATARQLAVHSVAKDWSGTGALRKSRLLHPGGAV
jgi:hypothetical protein